MGHLGEAERLVGAPTLPDHIAVFAAVVDISDDAVFSLDPGRHIASWNRSAERIFGHSEAEIVGQDVALLFPAHLRPDVTVLFETVAAGDQVNHFETEIQRQDGMLSPISLSACPIVGVEATVVAVVARDITEQVLAQATLAEVESRGREREALAHVGGWLWDVHSGAVQWTDEFHRIHGVEPHDFEGTLEAHLARVHRADRDAVRAAMRDSVESGRRFEQEYRVVRPDGDIRWLYASATPTVGSAGTVVGLRGIGQDLTDRGTSKRVSGP
jgi:PAS domain S-box-containing protein